MMEIKLTNDFEMDCGERTSCNVVATNHGKPLMSVHFDFEDEHKVSYTIDPQNEYPMSHRVITLILYHASLYIDSYFDDQPCPNVDQNDGSYLIK